MDTGGEGARGGGLGQQADVHRCKTDTGLDRRMRALLSGDEIMVLKTKNVSASKSICRSRAVRFTSEGFPSPCFYVQLGESHWKRVTETPKQYHLIGKKVFYACSQLFFELMRKSGDWNTFPQTNWLHLSSFSIRHTDIAASIKGWQILAELRAQLQLDQQNTIPAGPSPCSLFGKS